MTGDSHVSGKIYPREVGRILEEAKPSVIFNTWGKGGAGFYTFNDTPAYMDSIYNADPDILIVHLGTNDSYARSFNEERFVNNMTTFYNNVHSRLPNCKIVFVSPFYNKNRQKGTTTNYTVKNKKGKSVQKSKKIPGAWQVNHNTRLCSDAILNFVKDHPNTFIVDNNAEHGMEFLEGDNLIREDYVHLTIAGYELLGQQVAESLLNIPELWENIEQQQP